MRISLLGELEVFDDDGTARGRSRAPSSAPCWRCWRCTQGGWFLPTSSSRGCGARTRRRRSATACRGSSPSCDELLGSAGLIVMRGGGYALDVAPDAVDVHRFEQLVAAGTHGGDER